MSHFPQPLDTSDISLSIEYLRLAEGLAENDHCRWSQALLDLGWRYGHQFDPIHHTHPHLVAFNALPTEVRTNKLKLFLENLKTVRALGYRLDLDTDGPLPTVSAPSQFGAKLMEQLQADASSPATVRLASLMALRSELFTLQPNNPDLHAALGDMLLQQGEPILAYDVLISGLNRWPNYLRLQQLLALALARSGATLAANQLLLELIEAGQRDEQTLGLLARTHKDLWKQATQPEAKAHHLKLAATQYLEAYRHSHSLWTGINAATMAMMQGQENLAQTLAAEVRTASLTLLEDRTNQGKDVYWVLATLGEAALILKDWEAAAGYYTEAARMGRGRFGDLSSSYRNAALLMGHFNQDPSQLNQWFVLPKVALFCGHRLDTKDRPIPRFPAQMEPLVYQQIYERLQQMGTYVGYASAASGSDILFLEALLALEGECNIVLPYERQQFVEDSVALGATPDWVDRFDRVLAQAREVIIASDHKPKDDTISYEYSNRLLHGLASIRAQQLQTDLVPLAVWDQRPGDGHGGTASTVAYWRNWNQSIEIIDLAVLLQQHFPEVGRQAQVLPVSSQPQPASPDGANGQREICALLFADVVHYTDLQEEQVFTFSQQFLGAIAALSAENNYHPLMKNTWGDALYFVFDQVQAAGLFALALCDLMHTTDWEHLGLPSQMNLRIALHAGPVYRHVDPITRQVNYIGNHVNHAARIEPITPPGRVYASQAFAAIAASEQVQGFACDYVGQMPWAKHYGTFPTYHVHR